MIFLLFCISAFQIYSFGYYAIPITENTISINLDKPSSIIVQYQLQTIPFLEATIKSLDDDTYSKIVLDPTQNAIIYGKNTKIYRRDNLLSTFIDVWVLPDEICPNIVFQLPNSTEYSIHLHSNNISNSICIFLPKYTQNLNQTIFYGVSSNISDQIVLYSNLKSYDLSPFKVCQDIFCSVSIFFPSFLQLRHSSLNSTSLHISLLGPQKIQIPLIPNPIPFYNYSGQYAFGDEFDVAMFHEISHPSKKKRFILVIALIFESIFMFLFILLKVVIKYMIYKVNKLNNKQETRDRRPLTVVLNQYCPNTSAMLVSV